MFYIFWSFSPSLLLYNMIYFFALFSYCCGPVIVFQFSVISFCGLFVVVLSWVSSLYLAVDNTDLHVTLSLTRSYDCECISAT